MPLSLVHVPQLISDSDFSSCDGDNSDDVMRIKYDSDTYIVIKASIRLYVHVCIMYYICLHILHPFFVNLHCLVKIRQKHTTSNKTNFHFHYEKHS